MRARREVGFIDEKSPRRHPSAGGGGGDLCLAMVYGLRRDSDQLPKVRMRELANRLAVSVQLVRDFAQRHRSLAIRASNPHAATNLTACRVLTRAPRAHPVNARDEHALHLRPATKYPRAIVLRSCPLTTCTRPIASICRRAVPHDGLSCARMDIVA